MSRNVALRGIPLDLELSRSMPHSIYLPRKSCWVLKSIQNQGLRRGDEDNLCVATFFSHSNYGKKTLKDKMKDEADRRGLVLSCDPLPAGNGKMLLGGLIKFDTKAMIIVGQTKPLQQYFIANSLAQLTLRLQLYNINMLQTDFSWTENIRELTVTCSDVFNIYIGIAIGFKEVVCDPVIFLQVLV
ncbi:hypothetical protein B0H10DRAFT_1964615 [Mycena sp. CBHHK59/15]|nr:hypothetical protein B0H10DRAFT_1964615 [Mycena sp. CBHHK59/15]